MPRLAILFWFYKAFDLCVERVTLLRRLNPDVPIYGLYGGAVDDWSDAQTALTPLLDDLFAFQEARDSHWKWLNGDQLIAAWMKERGQALAWDTVVVVQWDMLMLAPATELLGGLKIGEALFSGLRPMEEVADWWGWAGKRDPDKAAMLAAFKERLRREWAYDGPLWCCLFIVVCLPRTFLGRYADAGPPTEGFLEYKLPTLCRAWGVPVRDAPQFSPWWAADPSTRDAPTEHRSLNAVGEEVPFSVILQELANPSGRRVFHPFSSALPDVSAVLNLVPTEPAGS